MDQDKTADIPEIFEESSSSEEIEVQEEIKGQLIKILPSNLVKDKYLLNFKRWPIFEFLELEFILQIRMAMIFSDEGILIVTRDKTVYGFGNNKNKCLGIGDTIIALRPIKVEVLCGKNIKKFVYSKHGPRMFALTEEGEVYSWGDARVPGLGYAFHSSDNCMGNGVKVPTQISKLRTKRIIDIKCSESHSLALTNNGEVYIWGTISKGLRNYFYQDTPKQVNFKDKKIVQIACGTNFSMARSDKGKLYTWGENIFSASATLYRPDESNPYYIECLNEEIIKVCCGASHKLALTIKGEIYIWGNNSCGQLGLDTNEQSECLHPTLLPMPEKVSEIAIKQNDSNIALCENGCIYMWGKVTYFGQMCSRPTITSFLNMREALMFNNMPLTVFADDLEYIDEEIDVLKSWEKLFDKSENLSSDLIIQVGKQSIHVHKAILKKRSSYFRTIFQDDSVKNQIKKKKEEKESKTDVIKLSEYSYTVYKAFLKYLYTDIVDLDIVDSVEKLLELLDLAIVYCENKLEGYCILEIKRQITIPNVVSIYNTAIKHNKKELIEFCCNFALKHEADVTRTESFNRLVKKIQDDFLIKIDALKHNKSIF